MADLGATPTDPAAGRTGHFDHHVWLKDAVLALNAEVQVIRPTTETLPGSVTRTIPHASGLLSENSPEAVVLKEILDVLTAIGMVSATGYKA